MIVYFLVANSNRYIVKTEMPMNENCINYNT